MPSADEAARAPDTRRAYHFNAGFLTNARVRRILTLAGHDLRLGKPGASDDVLVWGHSPYAPRGEAMAEATGAQLVRVEDALLRGLLPGRIGGAPLGLVIDRKGMYFDARTPSDLEDIIATHPLDDTALLNRARAAVGRLKASHLSKFSATDPSLAPPEPGYVLIVDQTDGDASVRLGGANADTFREMLYWAAADHPGAKLIVKTHPETAAGARSGYLQPDDLAGYGDRVTVLTAPHSPWQLFEGAIAVYTVSSQMGFEAILSGHRPVTFGQPFYAGWGLTDDRQPITRRRRKVTRAQLAAACLILYPVWYNPYDDRLGQIEDVLGALEAQSREWREDRHGYTAFGAWSWKRPHLRDYFGRHGPFSFAPSAERATEGGRPVLVWAGAETEELRQSCARKDIPLVRVEDGFLRSRGLGAHLVVPLSLALDDLGIYFDPARESRLERLIAGAAEMPAEALARAERLVEDVLAAGLTKYSVGAKTTLPDTEGRPAILVPGQVEDDASIRTGTRDIATNSDLLTWARERYPDAYLVYKPHPDVEAGLRIGLVPKDVLAKADLVSRSADPNDLLGQVSRIVTMTSGMGFEALLRGVPVTTLGSPFYAGWGLTDDQGDIPARRQARPSVTALAHAVLIDYPRYMDPVTGLPCPAEIAVARLAAGEGFRPNRMLRIIARLQEWRGKRRALKPRSENLDR
ncbi:MAG: capsular polysaccharide biosynthesis protein [Pseudomonadota bacterium]